MTSLGWIWAEFSWIWASFLTDFGAAFAECQSRLARNEITENLKNMQITAEISKHQAQTKQINKTPIDNLQAAECKQLHQTPISKYGGGGARAAWRIRIRRPCLSERGLKGVSNNSADFCRLLQAAECRQLQQTPIFKYGGGGARAARRIRIRRPRLAERGFKACQIFTRTSADS